MLRTATHPGSERPGSIVATVRGMSAALVPSEARVARLVVEDPAWAIHTSIQELAKAADTSPATVMRFCRKLGFKGFQDFKIALARETMPVMSQLQGDVADDDTAEDILRKVVNAAAEATSGAANTIDTETFVQVVDLLSAAERVLVVGIGTSAPLVQDIAYRFLTIGLRAEAPLDVLMQHSAASLLTPNDVCLAISHTGTTRETIASVQSAVATGAKAIALTSYFQSPITQLATVSLIAGSKETSYRLEAMASRFAHLAVLDALYVAVAVRDRNRTAKSRDRHAVVLADHRF